jgi:single-strand DNA-binding protein
MGTLNKCSFIGYLGKDPELKEVGSSQVCEFSIGVSENWKDKSGQKQSKTEWINIQCWGNQANFASQYLKKGNQVYIEGKFQTQSWEKDGKTNYKSFINAFSVQSLEKFDSKKDIDDLGF